MQDWHRRFFDTISLYQKAWDHLDCDCGQVFQKKAGAESVPRLLVDAEPGYQACISYGN